ncbi:D-alanyl-D-alanine carboxypeptidase family protein [Actinotalea sp.]|uniref:M15 family metallopeptidase n=1 Tax=Actinotalea sp. TaxID=1872145 RepID=UPI002C3FE96D|nr:D-alanyl-D-alanine carboxypeptidase family protein [Actinotalea sp.]HRA51849.1 D-alanyl-D-alanine carboxypeptidase family protein [Actinotalea sp.]
MSHEAAHRARHRAAHRAPGPALARRQLVRDLCAPSLALLARPGVALAVASAFLAGAVLQVNLDQTDRDAVRAEQVAARESAAALVERTERADAARLNGQATVFAAQRRTEALVLAQTAVRTADQLATSASTVVDAATLTPLQEAVADLAALVEATPDTAAVVLAASRSADAVAVPGPVEESPAPTEPGADAVALLAGTTEQRTMTTAAAAADAAAVEREQAVETTIGDLDLDASARLVAAAQQVLVLSAEVQVTADAAIAAAAAAAALAQADEAARVAAEAFAAEVARRVGDTDAAPNGVIPRDLLCGVAFDDDVLLRCDAAAALDQLNAAYRAATGRDLDVVSSYRDLDEQAAVRAAKGTLAAAPGASNHGRALAIDIAGAGSLGDFSQPLYAWLGQHAEDFGWHHPDAMGPGGTGPLEPWHWEFDTP